MLISNQLLKDFELRNELWNKYSTICVVGGKLLVPTVTYQMGKPC